MSTLLWLVGLWLATGVVVSGTVFLVETLLTQARGPEYRVWLMKQGGSATPTRHYVGAVMFWPVVLALWLMAVGHKATIVEEITRINEALDKRKAAALLQYKVNWPPKSKKWTSARRSGKRMHIYVLSLPRGMLIAHAVTPMEGGLFLCWRAVANPEHNLPLCTTMNLRDAKVACEQDSEWLELCRPGKETERTEFWMRTMFRMKLAGGLAGVPLRSNLK